MGIGTICSREVARPVASTAPITLRGPGNKVRGISKVVRKAPLASVITMGSTIRTSANPVCERKYVIVVGLEGLNPAPVRVAILPGRASGGDRTMEGNTGVGLGVRAVVELGVRICCCASPKEIIVVQPAEKLYS